MSLSTSWALYFDSGTRMRGRGYFAEERVKPQPPQEGELFRAEVEGSEIYDVVFAGEGNPEDASCTCPHFADGNFCKHIWACLLYLDAHRDDLRDEVEQLESSPRLPKARKRSGERIDQPREPAWMNRLDMVRTPAHDADGSAALNRMDFMQVCYVLDPDLCRQRQQLVVELFQRKLSSAGWSKPKRLKLDVTAVSQLPEPIDRELCGLLIGADWMARQEIIRHHAAQAEYYDYYDNPRTRSAFGVTGAARWTMLQRMIETGRCFVATEYGEQLLSLDEASRQEPWVLWLVGERSEAGIEMNVELRRASPTPGHANNGDGGEHADAEATACRRMAIDQPTLLLGGGPADSDGIIVYDGKVARFDDRQAFRWAMHFRDELRKHGEVHPIIVPDEDVERFLDRLYLLADLPEIELPEGVGRGEQHVELVPHMELASPAAGSSRKLLSAQVWYAYGTHKVMPGQRGRFVALPAPAGEGSAGESEPAVATGPLIRRDLQREQELYASLLRAGFHVGTGSESDRLLISTKRMPAVVSQLLAQGWQIVADQRIVRASSAPRLSISSGIDWFELRGNVVYQTVGGEQVIDLPKILQAIKSGKATVKLDDGSEGLLPQEWLAEHGLLTAMGKLHADHLRFRNSQAALLDALLSRQEQVDIDDTFAAAREKLHHFEGVRPLSPAPTFQGTLRPYQGEGLGWFEFLRWFGMGGILADDMGLGKTIQILAMLDARYGDTTNDDTGHGTRDAGQEVQDTGHGTRDMGQEVPHRPSLIVVPRSVVFNWMDEAQKFAPQLRVQAYTGTDRHTLRDAFTDHDVIITSYGLMRRDIEELRKHAFDYVVLDEAQAIKNPASQSAKAARLLQAEHRLALTGTPVENHIGDLWSIFEFLNPGMLGSSTRFAELLRHGLGPGNGNGRGNGGDPNASAQIARALRPFILRRTKKQVLKDLPDKTEQTIHCQMEPDQRAIYDELRKYFRQTLLSNANRPAEGNGESAGPPMLVLEALLRLRQAACHPALIDDKHASRPSAKMDVLLDRLSDLVEEGHKALVFSQFTSMLALVRKQLEARGINYAYLDGQTRKRKQVVDQFQNDPNCPVFLISLKAGGFGLNLTAAEYVFILDPWWNPAVEAQAIDRTHRIGQTQRVVAYRLICEDTVEQRILELQDKKKRLAEAIVGGQESLLQSLTRDDLERLLS